MNFYNQVQTYYEEYKSCCRHNCIRQILEYYGFKCAHLMFNTNFNFIVEEKEGGIFITRESPEMLVNNIPIVTDVDVYYLNYDKHFKISSSVHSIILTIL